MSDSKKPTHTLANRSKGLALLPLLSLLALIPFALFVRDFIHEVPRTRDWNPAWAGESIVMATGISLGLVLSSPPHFTLDDQSFREAWFLAQGRNRVRVC